MPELTDQQSHFVREYVRNGGRGAEAARVAGFSEHSAGKYAYQLLEKSHVCEAVRHELRRTFTQLAAIATDQARMMLEDPKTPPGARAELIRAVWDRAGLVAPKTADPLSPAGLDLSGLSLAQLEKLKAAHEAMKGEADVDGEGLDETT